MWLWYFGAQLLSLQPCCLRLAHYITVTHSRLASNAVVSSLFDRISTCRIARPSLDARSGTNVVGLIPHFYLKWAASRPLVHSLLCQCPLGLIPHFYISTYLFLEWWVQSSCQCPLGLIPHFYARKGVFMTSTFDFSVNALSGLYLISTLTLFSVL